MHQYTWLISAGIKPSLLPARQAVYQLSDDPSPVPVIFRLGTEIQPALVRTVLEREGAVPVQEQVLGQPFGPHYLKDDLVGL